MAALVPIGQDISALQTWLQGLPNLQVFLDTAINAFTPQSGAFGAVVEPGASATWYSRLSATSGSAYVNSAGQIEVDFQKTQWTFGTATSAAAVTVYAYGLVSTSGGTPSLIAYESLPTPIPMASQYNAVSVVPSIQKAPTASSVSTLPS